MKVKTHIDYYAAMARDIKELTQVSGRYKIQKSAEKYIVLDVIQKLKIRSDNSLLEVGCGPGNLLIPLSFFVESCVGIDHQAVIKRFKGRFNSPNIELIGSDFFSYSGKQKFDKILIYSVLPTIKNEDRLFAFIEKALSMLKSSGRMLLGDLNNKDKKDRFLKSKRGKKFQDQWNKLRQNEPDEPVDKPIESGIYFSDELQLKIINWLRKKGWDTYLYEQPEHLPFGNTREDIVVKGPEFSEFA